MGPFTVFVVASVSIIVPLYSHCITPICNSPTLLDLILILDSQGGVYDNDNWQFQLDFARTIVNGSLPNNTRVALINYNGCNSTYSSKQCKQMDHIKLEWGLSNVNNQYEAYDRLSLMNENDFSGDYYSWTSEAFDIALDEFQNNSTQNRRKMIILLNYNHPTTGHNPCESSTGYISPSLRTLKQMDTIIIAVSIDSTIDTNNEYFKCMIDDYVDNFYSINKWTDLSGLASPMIENICDKVNEVKLVINEVFIEYVEFNETIGENLIFVELYNPSIPAALTGYRFNGMINYNITEDIHIEQGQYWVISTFDMSLINKSQDLIVDSLSPEWISTDYWYVDLYDAQDNLVNSVTKLQQYFPDVDDGHSFELQYPSYNAQSGGNWKESCYCMYFNIV